MGFWRAHVRIHQARTVTRVFLLRVCTWARARVPPHTADRNRGPLLVEGALTSPLLTPICPETPNYAYNTMPRSNVLLSRARNTAFEPTARRRGKGMSPWVHGACRLLRDAICTCAYDRQEHIVFGGYTYRYSRRGITCRSFQRARAHVKRVHVCM